ncbi:hypothetical protein GCM10010218_16650 [Streptomyces mashuensis]|uniref:Secreted protein n=1 Tax=Streptomyces mashuensis TaxID=33904 RepID=A0A919B084_9ACTN|nr:hypothetical protein [Streptomyces mashuensis]GHF35882.1 hypothetical protein GCM10010218_16650 [Streptomyces mashuensis]
MSRAQPDPGERRAAWREGLDRLRAAATTEPGRLRVIGAALAALLVAFGGVTAWQVTSRAAAADAVVTHSQPLSADAADIYRSLADADTAAATGFLAGGREPRAVRQRYENDISVAARLLAEAAAGTDADAPAGRQIATLTEQLPVYTGLVEQARAAGRQGLPLGGAYLRYASDRMREQLLPAAQSLYVAETLRLESDYDDATAWPWAALATGVAALGALGWAQRRTYLRTHRVFNHGLVGATAAATVTLLWLTAGHGVASAGLSSSRDHGARALQVLNEARIASLQARGDESLTLVARGAVLTAEGEDAYEAGYQDEMQRLTGRVVVGERHGETDTEGLLGRARSLTGGPGRERTEAVLRDVTEWQRRHRSARAADESGYYDRALPEVIGEKNSTGEMFDRVDAGLRQALVLEQKRFRTAADDGRGALTGLAAGAAVLALLGATAAVLGVGRRLSEYR